MSGDQTNGSDAANGAAKPKLQHTMTNKAPTGSSETTHSEHRDHFIASEGLTTEGNADFAAAVTKFLLNNWPNARCHIDFGFE